MQDAIHFAARRAGMQNEKGQTTTEYGLILVILSIAVLVVMATVAGSVTELYQDAAGLVHTALESVIT
jgi:Flp pilus assembly pilin Flp